MVAPAAPHALVEQHLPARVVDLAHELRVLLLAEVRLAWVRPPQQPAHVGAVACEVGEHVPERGARPDETLVGVTLPIGEVHPVIGADGAELVVEPSEVVRAVDEHLDAIAFGPRQAVGVATVDLGGRVAAFLSGEEPVVETHAHSVPRIAQRHSGCIRFDGSASGHDVTMTKEPDPQRVQQRADQLTADELKVGSDDPEAQAEEILLESDERTDDRVSPPGQPVEHRHSEDTVDPTD